MLIEFRVSNFRSFAEEQTLSLVASKARRDDKHPQNLIHVGDLALLKTAAIYGANASGKSNLVRAFGFFGSFIRNSATTMNQGDKINEAVPFRLADDLRESPSRFEITLLIDQRRYVYGFSATEERVFDEWLEVAPSPSGKAETWFTRNFNPETRNVDWLFKGPLKQERELLREKTRDNGLVLSRGAELNIEPLGELFLWFVRNFRVIDLSSPPDWLVMGTAGRIKKGGVIGDRLLALLTQVDFGIKEIVVQDWTTPLEVYSEENRRLLLGNSAIRKALGVRRIDDGTVEYREIKAIHSQRGTDANVEFDFREDESMGTQRFFGLAGFVLDALESGRVLVIDEFDCSMHPLLSRKLIEMFHQTETAAGGQMVFATHDSSLMDPTLLRRDQIWLVEKDEGGASKLFSLYDFSTEDRPRNTEAFERRYLAGRYGGVPKFGPLFEGFDMHKQDAK